MISVFTSASSFLKCWGLTWTAYSICKHDLVNEILFFFAIYFHVVCFYGSHLMIMNGLARNRQRTIAEISDAPLTSIIPYIKSFSKPTKARTNSHLLYIWTCGRNFSENWVKLETVPKISMEISAKCRPSWSCLQDNSRLKVIDVQRR